MQILAPIRATRVQLSPCGLQTEVKPVTLIRILLASGMIFRDMTSRQFACRIRGVAPLLSESPVPHRAKQAGPKHFVHSTSLKTSTTKLFFIKWWSYLTPMLDALDSVGARSSNTDG